ncbi:MAG: hypothetical protein GXO42_00130 [bacterium]|nr:hypothetical protein [bacterium]
MYSRYIVCLSLLFLGIVVGALHSVQHLISGAERLGGIYSRAEVRALEVLYVLPPAVERGIVAATDRYLRFVWNYTKQHLSGPEVMYIQRLNDHVVIKYVLKLQGGLPYIYRCYVIGGSGTHELKPAQCTELSLEYVACLVYFGRNLSWQRMVKQYYTKYLYKYINRSLAIVQSLINNRIKGLHVQYKLLALQVSYLGKHKSVTQGATKIIYKFMVVPEVLIHEANYNETVELPYTVTIVIEGIGANYKHWGYIYDHVYQYLYGKSRTISVQAKCADVSPVTVNNCQSSKRNVDLCKCVASGTCNKDNKTYTNYVENTSTGTCTDWQNSGSAGCSKYTDLSTENVPVNEGFGFAAVQDVYHVNVTVVYRQDLIGLHFYAVRINPITNWYYTPVLRTTAVSHGVTMPNDVEAKKNKICFAFNVNAPSSSCSYNLCSKNIYGIPWGAGWCNEKVCQVNGKFQCTAPKPVTLDYGSCSCGCGEDSESPYHCIYNCSGFCKYVIDTQYVPVAIGVTGYIFRVVHIEDGPCVDRIYRLKPECYDDCIAAGTVECGGQLCLVSS